MLNLVTGGTGQIGAVLIRELCAAGREVRVLVRKGRTLKSLQQLPLEIAFGDILDRKSLQQAMGGVENVFHLAGIIPTKPGAVKLMQEVNVQGTRNVCDTAMQQGIKRLVYVSSVNAFCQEPRGAAIDETRPLDLDSPLNSYSRSKAEATALVLEMVENGLNAVVVCPSGVIGSNEYPGNDNLSRALFTFARGKVNFIVQGAFDFVDVRDVSKGLIAACDKGRCGEIYILSGTRVRIAELHQITQKVAGVSSPAFILPTWLALFGVSLLQKLMPVFKINSGYNVYSLQTLLGNTFYSSEKAKHELAFYSRPFSESINDCLFRGKS